VVSRSDYKITNYKGNIVLQLSGSIAITRIKFGKMQPGDRMGVANRSLFKDVEIGNALSNAGFESP